MSKEMSFPMAAEQPLGNPVLVSPAPRITRTEDGQPALETFCTESETRLEISIFFTRNPLKSPDSEKLLKIKKENEKPFSFHFLSFSCVCLRGFALWLYSRSWPAVRGGGYSSSSLSQ
jgi:hypothetical protein